MLGRSLWAGTVAGRPPIGDRAEVTLPVSFKRIAVIHNPNSGRPRERQSALDQFQRLLTAAGRDVHIYPTRRPNHATDLAQEAVASGHDMVVAHGGDGTMNEVLQSLVGTDTTLCFWPGGTANVLAAELNFPSRVEEVARRIVEGRTKRVTVGRAGERYFLLMAGVGLDAAVAGNVDPLLKRRLGKGAFAVSAAKFLYRWNLAPFRVHLPGGEEVVGRFLVAGNARSYGGGFHLTPQASLTEPVLDLCIFGTESRVDYLGYAAAAVFGIHREMPGVVYRKVTHARVTSASRDAAPLQLDGEVVGHLPVDLSAIPEAVSLLV